MQSTEDGFTGGSSYSNIGDQLMEDLETPILLSQYGAFLFPSMMAFRPKAGVKGNLIGKAKIVAGSLEKQLIQGHLLAGWRGDSLANINTQIQQALMRPWDMEHRGVGRGKDAEFCKLGQKRNESRNGKQDSPAS